MIMPSIVQVFMQCTHGILVFQTREASRYEGVNFR